MAENRMIRTKIWSDDWFSELSADAKLLYFYVLTNKNTHICGYYQTSLKEIEFFTGLNKKRVMTGFEELQTHVDYIEDWVCIKNYAKYQNLSNNEKVQKLIEREMKNVPSHVLKSKSKSKSKSEAMDSLSIPSKNDQKVDKPVENEKREWGKFKNVLLTDSEKETLIETYGREPMKKLVTELDEYIESFGYQKKYKSHRAVLQRWAREKKLEVVVKAVPKMIPETQADGSVRLISNPEYHG